MAGGSGKHRELPSVEELEKLPVEEVEYRLAKLAAPRLAGNLLRLFVWTLESTPLGGPITEKLKRDSGLPQVLRETSIPDSVTPYPIFPQINVARGLPSLSLDDSIPGPASSTTTAPETRAVPPPTTAFPARLARATSCLLPFASSPSQGDPPAVVESEVLTQSETEAPPKGTVPFRFNSIREYAERYRRGEITPVEVAERFLSAVSSSQARTPPLNLFINLDPDDVRRQARLSADRIAAGTPLSSLDGVLVAVKDEIDCLPYPTTAGTSWLHTTRPVSCDALAVLRLRACGAVIVGKTNMHEIGFGTTGLNCHHGTARNPHDPTRFPGGSSSGSAAVVAAGLVPAALGMDGGGSIRIPAALCGVVGLKGTYGRVPLHGAVELDFTVGMMGPLTATVEDAILMYAALAGASDLDPSSLAQPPIVIPNLQQPLEGFVVGIYWKWFEDADSAVVEACKAAIEELKARFGVQVRSIAIPELEELRVAHVATFASENAAAFATKYDAGMRPMFSYDVRLNQLAARSFSGFEYVQAQRIRTRCLHHHLRLLQTVDAILTPTTGCTAPQISSDALAYGESNLPINGDLMRFIAAGNLVGLPAISVPVGYDSSGLPIGLQAIAGPWAEAQLLRLAVAIEEVATVRRKPAVYYDMLLKE